MNSWSVRSGSRSKWFCFFVFILPDKKILTHNSSELAENVFWLWQMDLDIWIEIIEESPTEDSTFSILSRTKSRNITHSKAGLLCASSWELGANGFHSLVTFDSGKHSHCYSICMWFYNVPNMMSLFFSSKDGRKLNIWCLKSHTHSDRAVCTRAWFA